MQRAALLITALIGIASAYPQAPSGGAGGAPGAKDPAMESAMSNTCQAMETFWSGMTPDCVNGVKALMRQPNTPIGTIKSQVAAYVGANCSSSTDALNKLEAAINNTIQVANDTVQKSSQIPAEGKALISQMMSIPQNQVNSPVQICTAELTALKGADPNVSAAIIRHMMMMHRHHGGPGGPEEASGSSGGAPNPAAAAPAVPGAVPPAPGANPAAPSAGAATSGMGSGPSGGMSGGVANWLRTVDPASFCQEKMSKMQSAAASAGGSNGGVPHFPMCGGMGGGGGHEEFFHSQTGGSNVMAAASQHSEGH